MVIQIERLKKDQREALYYQRRLKKRGKDILAYKMQKKIEYLSQQIKDINQLGG
jgi:hypothetical protein